MNLSEAKAQMINGDEYKFVGTLVPPMLAFARIGDILPSHVRIGRKLDLLTFDEDAPTETAYKPVDPKNFRAGTILVDNGELVLTEPSGTFPKNMPTKKEFTSMLNGDISVQD